MLNKIYYSYIMDWKYSYNQPTLTIKSSYPNASINNDNNCKNKMIQYFYNAMLNLIVDKWEDTLPESTESIASGDRVFIIPNPTYICETDDGVDNLQFSKEIRSSEISERVSSKHKSRKSHFRAKKVKKTLSSLTLQRANLLFIKLDRTALEVPDFEELVTVTFRNGNIYIGPTYKKKFNGTGQFRWSDGSFYIGDFVNGQITGKGKFYFADQSTYEGEVFEGYPHGFGKRYVANSPSAYCGEWRGGLKHGQGWLIYAENDWYEGSWNADQMHGKGIRFYSSGDKYEGDFCRGKRHGNGCAIFRNNDFYLGEWNSGERSGYGEYVWNSFFNNALNVPVCNKYMGYWEANQMHGKGELIFGSINGSRYIGDFSKNLKHGKGIVICDNGRVIDNNLMFLNNEPVQKFDMENCKPLDFCDKYEPVTTPDMFDSERSQLVHLPSFYKNRSEINRRLSSYHINTKVFRFPSIGIEKESVAQVNLCKFKFPVSPPKRCSLQLPISVTAENIDLDPIILTLCGLLNDNWPTKLPELDEKPKTWNSYQQQKHYDPKHMYHVENKALRNAIKLHLRRLKQIYKQYSLVGCLRTVPFPTLLNRLFLWQMFRDCRITEKGISLTDIDILLAESTASFSESIHDPFENIYFWQFLTVLLKISWKLYGHNSTKYIFECDSILEHIFTKFLSTDLYPYVGQHIGSALFDFRDTIPIQSAYNWYKSIQEPMSVQTFFRNIFTLNKQSIEYVPTSTDMNLNMGINILVGNQFIYLIDKEDECYIRATKEKLLPLGRNCKQKPFYFLHELGGRRILKQLKIVVPGIFDNADCINYEYKLCFLEFYEMILLCTSELLKRRELKLQKRILKVTDEEDGSMLVKILLAKRQKERKVL